MLSASIEAEFWIARVAFLGAAIAATAAIVMWLIGDLKKSSVGIGRHIAAGSIGELIVLAGLSIGLYWVAVKQDAVVTGAFFDESMPGFVLSATIKLLDTPALRRKYLFQAADPENGIVSVYLTPEDKFLMSVKDVYGESYPLPVSLGYKGVPFNKFIFLTCEIGFADNKTGLAVFVNDRLAGIQIYPVTLNVGSRNWSIRAFGKDGRGNDPGSFETAEFGMSTTSLSADDRYNLWENTNNYFHLYDEPRYLEWLAITMLLVVGGATATVIVKRRLNKRNAV